MNTRMVIDHILEEVAQLVAQLATLRGNRSLVADLPDRFFLHLALALEAQGLPKKLVADMSGLVLRAYQKRLQRLQESRSDAGRTLWEAVYSYLHDRGLVTRAELDRRFVRDDPQTLGSVVHDLVDGGLVFRMGTGATAVYRAAREGEVALDDSEGAEALVWLSIYRLGPVAYDALLLRHRGLDEAALDGVLASLMRDGRVTATPGERVYQSRELVAAGPAGVPAAIADHVHAVFATLTQALGMAPDDPKRAWTGGSTYTLDVASGDAHAKDVEALLPRLRAELGALRVAAETAVAGSEKARARVTIYCGVTAAGTPANAPRTGDSDS